MPMKRPKPSVEPDRLYSIKEVCDVLSICRDTVRKYTANETIVATRVSSREIYYLGSEILNLHEALTNSDCSNK